MTGLGKCGCYWREPTRWLAWEIVAILSASTYSVTGLGNCSNVIGEHLLGDWPWKFGNHVIGELQGDWPWQMWKSYRREPTWWLALAMVTGLGNCGNVVGELLLDDWPWQLWQCYRRAPSRWVALANVEMLSVRTYTVTGLGNVRFHKELPWLFHLVLEKWLMCYRCCRDRWLLGSQYSKRLPMYILIYHQ